MHSRFHGSSATQLTNNNQLKPVKNFRAPSWNTPRAVKACLNYEQQTFESLTNSVSNRTVAVRDRHSQPDSSWCLELWLFRAASLDTDLQSTAHQGLTRRNHGSVGKPPTGKCASYIVLLTLGGTANLSTVHHCMHTQKDRRTTGALGPGHGGKQLANDLKKVDLRYTSFCAWRINHHANERDGAFHGDLLSVSTGWERTFPQKNPTPGPTVWEWLNSKAGYWDTSATGEAKGCRVTCFCDNVAFEPSNPVVQRLTTVIPLEVFN